MRTELSFLTASVFINVVMLYTVDNTAVHMEQRDRIIAQAQQVGIAKKMSSGPIAFEYVESPKAPSRKPIKKTARISDRDSVNQGMTKNKSLAEDAPNVKTMGPSDQLAQKKGVLAPPMTQASPEVKPQPKQATQAAPRLSGEGSKDDEISLRKKEELPEQMPKKYSPQSPPARPSDAQDRITTSELSKSRSRGAQIYGLTSFEATGSGMGVYMKNLKEKIWLAWFPYLVTKYPMDYKSADAVVSFKLNAQGDVKILELVESKGSPLFASFCMEAVQRAGSFGPLPKEILALVGKDEPEIKFAFHYW